MRPELRITNIAFTGEVDTGSPSGNAVKQDLERFRDSKKSGSALGSAFGERIFEDDNHLIIPSIREIDGEERFKVIGIVAENLFTGVFVWRGNQSRFISVRRSNKGEERAYYAAC